MYGTILVLSLASAAVVSAQFPLESPFPESDPILIQETPVPKPRVAELRAPDRDLVIRWNDAVLSAIKAEKTPPPVAARNLAVVHVAIYDSVNAVHRTHQPFRVRASALPGTSPEAAAAVAAHRALFALYPKQTATFDALLDESLEQVPEGAGKTNGIVLGQAVAEKVLAWRKGDMALRRSDYAARSELGRWQSTPPGFKPPLLPQWAALPSFAMTEVSTMRPAGPPALTSVEFAASFREVKELGGAASSTRTKDQTEIARFWADGDGTITPPGHWNRIAQTIAVAKQTSLAENARLFALLNVAMADVAICCWDCKYHFDFWRPVTAIRAADQLNRPELSADKNWLPLLTTPPFPAYTSGHSTFSAAAAAALAAFFGTDSLRFSSTSDGLPGVTRSFTGFRAAADEAGISRIYGGIHWSFDNRDGLEMGKQVGEYVSKSYFHSK